jgi:hypothetical protein
MTLTITAEIIYDEPKGAAPGVHARRRGRRRRRTTNNRASCRVLQCVYGGFRSSRRHGEAAVLPRLPPRLYLAVVSQGNDVPNVSP